MWPGRGVAAYPKSVFSTQFSATFTFLFPQHSRLLSSRKRELYIATQFSFFVCRPLFPVRIVGVWRSSETSLWKFDSTPCRGESVTGDFFLLAFSERKIVLEIFPKKDDGTLQITVQSTTNATFETVGQVRKAIFACLTTD